MGTCVVRRLEGGFGGSAGRSTRKGDAGKRRFETPTLSRHGAQHRMPTSEYCELRASLSAEAQAGGPDVTDG